MKQPQTQPPISGPSTGHVPPTSVAPSHHSQPIQNQNQSQQQKTQQLPNWFNDSLFK